MKVLHVVPSLALRHGGVSLSVRQLCLALAQKGVVVQVCTTRRGYLPSVDEAADRKLISAGVDLHYLPTLPWKWLSDRTAYSPSMKNFLEEAIPRADLVHIHALWLYPTHITAQLCRRAQVPYVISPCGALDPYSLKRKLLLKRIYGLCVEGRHLRGAAAIHFTSDLEKAQAYCFGSRSPRAVISRCLDLSAVPILPPGTFRGRHPEVGSRKILLFLGRLHPKKRLDLATEAFIRLAQRRADVHLVIAGPDDGSKGGARLALQKAHLLDRATFTGLLHGEEKWAVLQDSSLFLLQSEDENFGLAALEAMASGIPVLISPRVGLSDIARQAGSALIVNLHTADWADQMDRVLSDPTLAKKLGESGRRLVEEQFSSERVAVQMKTLYASLLADFRPDSGLRSKVQAHIVNNLYRAENSLLEVARRLLWPGPRPQEAKRICVYRIGNIGDAVCALPALDAIRHAYPHAHLMLLTSPGRIGSVGFLELLEGADWLNEILPYYTHQVATLRQRASFLAQLRSRRFDLWVELPNDLATLRTSFRNMLMARLAGARWAYGWRINNLRWGAQAQSEHLAFPDETSRLLQVIREAGLPVSQPAFPLPLRDSHRQSADRLLRENHLTDKLRICLSPAAKRSTNRWPPERFIEVGRHLIERGVGVMVVGGPSDAQLCQQICDTIGQGAVMLAGKVSLLETAELLRRCNLVVCNDSGIQHLAAAVGTRCISIFSSWQLRTKWHPFGPGHIVLQKWVGCHTCFLEKCPFDQRCIRLTESSEVVDAILSLGL